jgi:GDP/UDP-N,N'-diacetylbacillosamine 2-epimerase (hydrolysing)
MKILFVLGARSEFGYILPVYREAENRGHSPSIWACNSASLSGFGGVAQAAKDEGMDVRQIVATSFDGYSHLAMAKSVGAVTQSLADFLGNERFDWVVLSGDRAEQLGAAVASSYMNFPTAHVQAGERSGNIDGMARHAIARLAHLHFAANSDAFQRLIRSGEEEWRVINSGAPQLDGLVDSATSRAELIARRLVPSSEYVLAVFHPETSALTGDIEYLAPLLRFLRDFPKPVVWIAPNNDAGAMTVRDLVTSNLGSHDFLHENLARPDFAGILGHCSLVVGNSSAGIIEAPSFRKVAINLGRRQHSRFQGTNVINVPAVPQTFGPIFSEAEALSRVLVSSTPDAPYGRGESARIVVDALENFKNHPELTLKQLSY